MAGGDLFFVAGGRLWKTHGSGAGTVDVTPASAEAFLDVANLTAVGSDLFFTTRKADLGGSLWKFESAVEGAVLVRDFSPAEYIYSGSAATAGGLLYFGVVGDAANELWKSDGTTAGTVQVSLPGQQLVFWGHGPVAVGDDVYYSTFSGELWKAGESGAAKVKFLGDPSYPGYANGLTNVGGVLYFYADSISGTHLDLWKSDGTAEGTVVVEDIPRAAGAFPLRLANDQGTLLFTMLDDLGRGGLWKSHGAPSGATLVKIINEHPDGNAPDHFVQSGGLLYFTADDGHAGIELWRTDGTPQGTFMVKDVNPGGAGSSPANLTDVYGTLYFTAYDPAHGEELWMSDGTAAGTALAWDFTGDGAGSAPGSIAPLGGGLVVAAATAAFGHEFWAAIPDSIGDYDVDGVADGHDFLAWQRQLGSSAPPFGLSADGNESGKVDAADLAIWQSHFGQSAAPDVGNSAAMADAALAELEAAALMGPLAYEFEAAGGAGQKTRGLRRTAY
jgi:ELWxxDGT repeat protein